MQCELPAGDFDLRVGAKGFISHYFWQRQLPPRASVDLGVLQLVPGSSISGWLETEDDSPLQEGTRIVAIPRASQAELTDEQTRRRSLGVETVVSERGFFHLRGLPPGAYHLEVQHEGFVPLRSPPAVVDEVTETELVEPLVLSRPAALWVSVEPTVDPVGEPWSLMLVSPPVTEPADYGRSDPQGAWTAAGLRPGAYLLSVSDSRGSRVTSEEVTVAGLLTEHWVNVEYVEVEGLVTLGKEPLAAELIFGGESGMTSVRMQADEEGRFDGMLPRAGVWPVDVKSRKAGVFRRLQGVEVEPSASSSRARVDIELPGTRLEGEVVDPQWQGLPQVNVVAIPAPRKPGEPKERPSYTRTGEGGLFSFEGFAPAAYRLQAVRVVGQGEREVSESVEVTLTEEDPLQLVRLVLGRQTIFNGRVLSASGGVPGATIIVRPLGREHDIYIPSAHSGPDGSFAVSLPEDTRQVEVTVMAAGFLFYRQTLGVPEEGEASIGLEQEGGGTLVIRPRPPNQREHPQGYAHIVRGDGTVLDFGALARWSMINQAPPAGETIEIPRLPSGSYTVCWPISMAQRLEGQKQECDEGHLPAHGRLEITRQPAENSADAAAVG
ncbi:MAG: carboxypeptidase-like regulatory domain-containing protein [Acidobacteriota bacterium]